MIAIMYDVDAAAEDRELTVVAAGDLHGYLPEVGPCDLLVLAGDLAPYDIERDTARCEAWFAGEFADWIASSGAAETVAIAGNHDFWAQGLPSGVHAGLFGVDWTYLADAGMTTRAGVDVYGTPWTRDDYDSAFEKPVDQLREVWAAIPDRLDILIAHCPPRGHGDEVSENGSRTHMGTDELLQVIARTRPRLVLYGHAHQAHGYRAEDPPGTRLANVSVRSDYAGGLGAVSELALALG